MPEHVYIKEREINQAQYLSFESDCVGNYNVLLKERFDCTKSAILFQSRSYDSANLFFLEIFKLYEAVGAKQ